MCCPPGRMYFSNNQIPTDGWNSISNKFEKVYAFGTRSISIWTTERGAAKDEVHEVWESGNKLASTVAIHRPEVFNGDCSSASQTPSAEFDKRSPHKVRHDGQYFTITPILPRPATTNADDVTASKQKKRKIVTNSNL